MVNLWDPQILIPTLLIPILILLLWRIGVRKIKSYNSPLLGKVEVYQKYNGEKLLAINSYAQGVSINHPSIKKSYWYKITEEATRFVKGTANPQVLMLGLGANTISSLINKLNPKVYQTIVEFDGTIIQACEEHFGLDKLANYTLIHADAYKLINKKEPFKQKFDVIIVDIYTGEPPYVSLKSNKPNFIEKLIPFLKKEGMVIFNRPGNTDKARKASEELKNYLSTLFKKTNLIDIKDPRGYRNNVITAITKQA